MAVGTIMSRVTRSIQSSADRCDEDPPALGRWPGSGGADERYAPSFSGERAYPIRRMFFERASTHLQMGCRCLLRLRRCA